MTCHYPDVCCVSCWWCCEGTFLQPTRSSAHIRAVTRHQYGITAIVPQMLYIVVASFECEGNLVTTKPAKCALRTMLILGSLLVSNDDGDVNENSKKAIGLN